MDKSSLLEAKIIAGKLFPDKSNVGEFIEKPQTDNFGFLLTNNWVFHDSVVDRVLVGDYAGIRPVCSEFDATLNCTNRCSRCAYRLPKELEGLWTANNFSDPDAHMPNVQYAKDLVLKLKEGGIKGIIFTGGGEPFVFQGLEYVVQYATNLGIDAVCYTNGNALSEERVKRLMHANPLLVRVSLNAGTKEVYNDFHTPFNPELAFDNTLRTIRTLAQGSKKNPNMSVGVGVVINEKNQDDLVNTALRLREIVEETKGRIDFVTYRPEYNYYGTDQVPNEVLDKTHEIVERDVKKVLRDTGIRVANVTNRYESLKQDTRNYEECRASGICSEITSMGAFFCCDRNFNRKYYIGNPTQQDIEGLYSGEARQNILDYISGNKCSVCPPACKSHELNKQFQRVEELRQEGKLHLVKLWVDEQRKTPKPKMVNFP